MVSAELVEQARHGDGEAFGQPWIRFGENFTSTATESLGSRRRGCTSRDDAVRLAGTRRLRGEIVHPHLALPHRHESVVERASVG